MRQGRLYQYMQNGYASHMHSFKLHEVGGIFKNNGVVAAHTQFTTGKRSMLNLVLSAVAPSFLQTLSPYRKKLWKVVRKPHVAYTEKVTILMRRDVTIVLRQKPGRCSNEYLRKSS